MMDAIMAAARKRATMQGGGAARGGMMGGMMRAAAGGIRTHKGPGIQAGQQQPQMDPLMAAAMRRRFAGRVR